MRSQARSLSPEQKRLDADLWILALVTFGAFLLYAVFSGPMEAFVLDGARPLLPRLLLNAGVQFGVAGLGSVIVCIRRRERLSSLGLRKKGALPAILCTLLCFAPSVLVRLGAGKIDGYRPFDILIAREVRSIGLPGSLLGMALIAVVWGFFEGWNYAVICDRIDARYPAKPRFLSFGALVCAAVCLLFHPLELSFWGLMESLTTFAAIYGMLLVKRETGNAWGCVAAFCLIWNAL